MKVRITLDLDPEWVDESHPMGITEAGYLRLSSVLAEFGTDVDVERVDDE